MVSTLRDEGELFSVAVDAFDRMFPEQGRPITDSSHNVDPSNLHRLDPPADQLLGQAPAYAFDFRQFGHEWIVGVGPAQSYPAAANPTPLYSPVLFASHDRDPERFVR